MKKVSPLLLILVVITHLHAKERLNFLLPAHPVLWGVDKIYVEQTAMEDSFAIDFTDSLKWHLDRIEYFDVIDQRYLKENFEDIFYNDSLTYHEKLRMSGDSIGIQIVLRCSLNTISLGPDEENSDEVLANIWTGEYERDEKGKIKYEVVDNDTLRLKKMVEKKILNHYRRRHANLEVSFYVHDFQTNALLIADVISRKYTSGKVYEADYKSLQSYADITDILVNQVIMGIVEHLEPRFEARKCHLEKDAELAEEAIIYAAEGLYAEAIDALIEVEQFSPGHASIAYNLGVLFEATGQYDDAMSYYRKALLVEPDKKRYKQSLRKLENAANHRLELIRKGIE